MKGHKTRATKAGIAAAKAETRKPERVPSSVEVSQLRAPTQIERQLFKIAVMIHNLLEHEGKFETCLDSHCVETQETLGVKGFLHRFDEPEFTE